jgi:pyrroloquinoline quinone biosynthesis protein B
MLREGAPLEIHCTEMVREDLTSGNPLFHILDHYCGVRWHAIAADGDSTFAVSGAGGLAFTAVPLKSKAPPYSPHRDDPHQGDNIGVRIVDQASGKALFYAPGVGEIEPHLAPFLAEADCLMIDGTFWTEDELVRLGISNKRARDMGHMPQSGRGGMIDVLKPLKAARKILIHINNTNPILNEDSAERRTLDAAAIEVAYDGMEIEL